MTTIYVGPTSAGLADGTSWANRYGTLNSAEDRPVVAGDEVVVGPGVYRETLTCDVSGTPGNPITYTADVTGCRTDGVGGIVRITGSDNDTTAARANCITGATISYRTFRGFMFDACTSHLVSGGADTRTNWIIEDCTLYPGINCFSIFTNGANQASWIARRCYCIYGSGSSFIAFTNAVAVDNTGHLVENCVCIGNAGSNAGAIYIVRVGGISIKNSTFIGSWAAVYVAAALTVGQTVAVNNCIIFGGLYGLRAPAVGQIIENYNSFYDISTPRQNVAVGANSDAYLPLFNPPLLQDGFKFQWTFGELSKWSQIARIADGGTFAADDMFGLARPATDTKRSRGAIQRTGAARETTTVDGVSGASIKLPDAGEQFLMRVPTSAVSTVFSLKCYRESDYAGTNPQMIIRQAGQADNVTTDVGADSAWNTLSATLTPAASPGWVDIFIRSSNSAVAGNYDVFFDSVTVT